MISLIAAAGENNEIGKDGRMPWNLPGDLQHFKALTLGRTMLMGRKTFQALPGVLPKPVSYTHLDVYKRQVSELVQKHELAMELEALSRRVAETKKNPDMEGFLQYARKQPKGQWPVALRIFTWGLPPITIALFLLGLCHILPLAAGSLCFVAQLGFLFVGYRKTNRILTPLFSLQDSLTPYETCLLYTSAFWQHNSACTRRT